MRRARNSDQRIRELERRAAQGDMDAKLALWRARQRAGGREGFTAAQEELRWQLRDNQEAMRHQLHAESRAIDEDAMKILRSLHPRIRRSKRRDLVSLTYWAEQVVGEDEVSAALAALEPARDQLAARADAMAADWKQRQADLKDLICDLSFQVDAQRGPEPRLFSYHRAGTYRTIGLGADGYAHRAAQDDRNYLSKLGFESYLERELGEELPPYGGPQAFRPWIRPGQGYRVFVFAKGPEDVNLLKARQDCWKERDWRSYHEFLEGRARAPGRDPAFERREIADRVERR